MSERDSIGQTGSPEVLAQCEGEAIHEPGVLFEERQAEKLSMDVTVAALAGWVAVTALGSVIGNSAHEEIKAKVVRVLTAWRQRFGQAKIDEVKQHLYEEMQRYRNHRKITDEALRERIELLFDEIRA